MTDTATLAALGRAGPAGAPPDPPTAYRCLGNGYWNLHFTPHGLDPSRVPFVLGNEQIAKILTFTDGDEAIAYLTDTLAGAHILASGDCPTNGAWQDADDVYWFDGDPRCPVCGGPMTSGEEA